MARLERRLEKLEEGVSVNPFQGKQSIEINVRDGQRCDIVLQHELENKRITLREVGCLTIVGGIKTRYMRDFQKHPEWKRLQELNESNRIWMIVIVRDKAEWTEYQRAMREEQLNLIPTQ